MNICDLVGAHFNVSAGGKEDEAGGARSVVERPAEGSPRSDARTAGAMPGFGLPADMRRAAPPSWRIAAAPSQTPDDD